ncbi:unnamed protein product, partial [Schistocephalus solidus]|uniref:Protein-tyrosine phosphatase n=1 Tax=Schistocephalus solidus TaxID=70667 RepID=A0A183SKG3_SCHSO
RPPTSPLKIPKENNDFAYREFQLSRGFSNTSSRSGDMTSPQLDQVTSPRVLNGTPVENGFEARRLIQLQFINWPDHGVPDDPAHLITFVEKFRSLLVHCSAGIGRTGVVILLDTAIDLIKAGHAVFPLELVRQMRYYREMLIQTSVSVFRVVSFRVTSISAFVADDCHVIQSSEMGSRPNDSKFLIFTSLE